MTLSTSTLVYSPAIKVVIAARSTGQLIDVSEDIISGNLNIRENDCASLSLTLANQNGKYSSLFHPNDRISVQMKRLTWVQVFSGYLDQVPYFSVYPKDVSITASCTLKKIKYQLWDPTYQPNITWLAGLVGQGILDNPGAGGGSSQAGIVTAMLGLLTEICGWSADRIHVGGIPPDWFSALDPIWNDVKTQVQQQIDMTQSIVNTAGNAGGSQTTNSAVATGQTAPDWGGKSAPQGCQLPLATGKATNYDLTSGQGPNTTGAIATDVPLRIDDYWAASHWSYFDLGGPWGPGSEQFGTTHGNPTTPAGQAIWGAAKEFLAGPPDPKYGNKPRGMSLVVTRIENNKSVVVRAADFEGASGQYAIDLSPQAFTDLLDPGEDISLGTLNVHVAFAADPLTPVGKVKNPVTASPNHVNTDVGTQSRRVGVNQTTPVTPTEPASQTATTTQSVKQADGGSAAAALALSEVGKRYVSGTAGPDTFDCSGLTQYVWAQQGITLPHNAAAQYNDPNVAIVDISQIQPGDLLFQHFPHWDSAAEGTPGHVGIYVGNGIAVSASNSTDGVTQAPIQQVVTTVTEGDNAQYFYGVGRVSNKQNKGNAKSGPVNVDPNTLTTLSTGLNSDNMVYGTGAWDPGAVQGDPYAAAFTGLKVLMNDTGLFPSVQQFAKAAQRHFCAAPNGDFIAWFPDYFGQYGYAAVWHLSPVEMQGFTINWDDSGLTTHAFTSGSTSTLNETLNPAAGGSVTQINEIYSFGVASIDVDGLLQALLNIKSTDGGIFADKNKIYKQFGPRPYSEPNPLIAANSYVEFWFAVRLFMDHWASQFSTSVQLTFMPELYPGMLLRIDEFGFQAYITSVSHSWDLSSDGVGFSTSVTIIAPSSTDPNSSGLVGLARSGPFRPS